MRILPGYIILTLSYDIVTCPGYIHAYNDYNKNVIFQTSFDEVFIE